MVVVCAFCPTVSGKARGGRHRHHCFFPSTACHCKYWKYKYKYKYTWGKYKYNYKCCRYKVQLLKLMLNERQGPLALTDRTAHGRWTHGAPPASMPGTDTGLKADYSEIHVTEIQNKDIQKCFLVHIVNRNVPRSSTDYPGVAPLCCLNIVQESFPRLRLPSNCQIARLPDCQVREETVLCPNCQIARWCEKRQCCVMSEQVHLMAATEPLKGALELWHYI